ncbi:MAG: class II aldolase/adducin family protein [Rhodospirillales bacterium]|nr:class II aldolase/adducin family protein [Rhodospirillales bacterium]MDE0378783.1 class II aldolase/adducin family protein [Rhodospirillales bacterium]
MPGKRPTHLRARRAVIDAARRMNALGLNHGTSGNVGYRAGKRFLVTPSGLDYDAMTPADIVEMGFDGSHAGTRRPTSEWRFHRDILASRPDVDAVLHSHAVHCTALAVHGMEIPAVHYMVAAAGGTAIRCAPYRTPTTQALSDVALPALAGRRACLLQNHGVIVLGETPDACVNLLVEVEYLAELYIRTLAIGAATGNDPKIISQRKMAEVLEIMKTYGKQPERASSET